MLSTLPPLAVRLIPMPSPSNAVALSSRSACNCLIALCSSSTAACELFINGTRSRLESGGGRATFLRVAGSIQATARLEGSSTNSVSGILLLVARVDGHLPQTSVSGPASTAAPLTVAPPRAPHDPSDGSRIQRFVSMGFDEDTVKTLLSPGGGAHDLGDDDTVELLLGMLGVT